MFKPEVAQFAAVQQSALESLVGLTSTAFSGVEKLVELNLQAVRSQVAGRADGVRQVLAARDPQALLAAQKDLLAPVAQEALDYGRRVYEIASQTQSELTSAASAQFAANAKQVEALVESLAKNAPVGGETAVAAFRSAFQAANNAAASVQKAAEQAGEFARSNYKAATTALVVRPAAEAKAA